MQQPRRFYLDRGTDPTGISGTGHVADGILWPDGTVAIRWTGDRPSTVHWSSLADAEHIHGHVGATRFVWLDDEDGHAEDMATRANQHAELLAIAEQAGNTAEAALARVRQLADVLGSVTETASPDDEITREQAARHIRKALGEAAGDAARQ